VPRIAPAARFDIKTADPASAVLFLSKVGLFRERMLCGVCRRRDRLAAITLLPNCNNRKLAFSAAPAPRLQITAIPMHEIVIVVVFCR